MWLIGGPPSSGKRRVKFMNTVLSRGNSAPQEAGLCFLPHPERLGAHGAVLHPQCTRPVVRFAQMQLAAMLYAMARELETNKSFSFREETAWAGERQGHGAIPTSGDVIAVHASVSGALPCSAILSTKGCLLFLLSAGNVSLVSATQEM
jgi:hypothetical protein